MSTSDKHPDIQHLVLYLPEGEGYEAMGSESGVWPRFGWSSIKNAAKKVGGSVKGGAKKVGGTITSGAKKAENTVKSGVKKVGSGVLKAGQAIRNQVCPPDPKHPGPFIHTDPK